MIPVRKQVTEPRCVPLYLYHKPHPQNNAPLTIMLHTTSETSLHLPTKITTDPQKASCLALVQSTGFPKQVSIWSWWGDSRKVLWHEMPKGWRLFSIHTSTPTPQLQNLKYYSWKKERHDRWLNPEEAMLNRCLVWRHPLHKKNQRMQLLAKHHHLFVMPM